MIIIIDNETVRGWQKVGKRLVKSPTFGKRLVVTDQLSPPFDFPFANIRETPAAVF